MFEIRLGDLSGQQTKESLRLHLDAVDANSPPGSGYALDLSDLKHPSVTVWTAWSGERLTAIGALKMLSSQHGEVKSMRTHPDFLRRGAGAAVLDAIISAARDKGAKRLSVETGSGEAFEPALALYLRRGFVNGPACADYEASSFNQFLHLDLAPGGGR